MKLIALFNRPIDSSELQLPLILLEEEINIRIESFSLAEKEELLGVRNLQKNDQNGWSFSVDGMPVLPLTDLHDFFKSENKIVLIKDTNNPYELQKVYKDLDFVFRVIIGRGLPVTYFRDGPHLFDRTGPGRTGSDSLVLSRRRNIVLNQNICDRIKISYQKLSNSGENVREKTNFLYAMLKIANKMYNSTYERGFACATYVAILESIFVPKKGYKTTYKFKNRINKLMPETTISRSRLIEFYKKRSTVFHGNEKYPLDEVTMEEMEQLESIACKAIENYLREPHSFTESELKKLDNKIDYFSKFISLIRQ